MNEKTVEIVVTTIFEPRFLEGYLDNLDRHGHRDHVGLIVIIDRKTPESVLTACDDAKRRGFRIACPTLEEQEGFLSKFPSMRDRIPYNTDNRRNVGFLMALDRGVDVMISIDDDNFCLANSDFVREHSVVGDEVDANESESSDRWFNIGSLLSTSVQAEIYPRGFPYFARQKSRTFAAAHRTARVAMNAGLWLTDPDVDALTRIAIAPRVSGAESTSHFLGRNTWSPINTQNTAISREAIAAYYYVRMGFDVGGLSIDRYGDILSGYLCQACVKARGETIRIGSPVADHRRTPHNLFKDLYHELAGVVLLDDLLPWLTEAKLQGSSYPELYAHLADELEARSSHYKGFIWDQGGDAFLRDTAAHMRAWLEAVRLIG